MPTTTPTRPEISAAVLAALRALLDEAQAELDTAEPGVWTILRAEVSGIKRAILRAESAVLAAGGAL